MTSVLRGYGTTITLNTYADVSGPIEISGVVDTNIVGSIPLTISGGINTGPINISGLTIATNPYVFLSGEGNVVSILNPVEISGVPTVTISGPITTTTNPYVFLSGEGNVVSILNPVEISGVPTVTISGIVNTIGGTNITISGGITLAPQSLDAFGRQRMSQPFTLFDQSSILGKDPIRMTEDISGVATITANSNSFIQLSVPATSSAHAIYQSKEYIPQQPGKSKLTLQTGILVENTTDSNIISRIGTFDIDNGHFYMQSNGDYFITERGYGVDCNVARSNWNDPLDGTGPSGCNVDFTKAQIFMMDQEWLGVGQVRMGVVIDGNIHFTYYWTHSGSNAVTQPQTKQAKLPVRQEIESTGSSNSMRAICASVQSEGGFLPFGRDFDYLTPSGQNLSNSNILFPVMSLRLRPESNGFPQNRATLKLIDLDLFCIDNADYGVQKILQNPVFSNESTSFSNFCNDLNSAAQIRLHSNTERIQTEGYLLFSGFWSSKTSIPFSQSVEDIARLIPIASDISGESDVVTLALQNLKDNTTDIFANLKWLEIM